MSHSRSRLWSRRHLLFWSVAALGTAADQITKILVGLRFPEVSDEPAPLVPGLFGILRHRNEGALIGLGGDHPTLLIVISFVAMGVILWLFVSAKPHQRLTDLALTMMMAGAAGNLIDRLVLGHVRDFIQFLFWRQYPVFNLADVWLTIGVGLMLLGLAFSRQTQAPAETEPAT